MSQFNPIHPVLSVFFFLDNSPIETCSVSIAISGCPRLNGCSSLIPSPLNPMNGKTCFAWDEATDLRIFDGITRRQAYRQAWEAAGVAGHL